jgi:hypothetical protein
MSYDPSHRTPPRQERWPQATPAEGWPSYRDGEGDQAARQGTRAQQAAGSHRRQAGPRSGVTTAAFPTAGDAYGTPGSHDTDGYRTGGYPDGGYTDGTDSFDGASDGYTHANSGRGQEASAHAADPDGYGWARLGYAATPDGYGTAENGYGTATNGYGTAGHGYDRNENGYGQAGNGYAGTRNGYARTTDDYAGAQDGYGRAGNEYARGADGYADAANGFDSAPDGYAGAANAFGSARQGYPSGGAYLGPGSYTETTYSGSGYSSPGYSDPGYSEPAYSEPGYSEPAYSEPGYSDPGYSDPGYSDPGYSETGYFDSGYSDSMLTAPDAGVYPEGWQADQARRRAARYRGLMVSAATEFLATAVVIGVSTLAAGLLRSTVSPVSAMGTVFIDHTPTMLRGFAVHHFGAHGRTVLLLGMYAVIAVVAITIGAAARRATGLGVTGVAAFTLVTAFVAVTRPASHVSDVMPAVIGGLAGVAALLWLVRASAPIQEVTPLRPARGGTRRRTR